MYDPFIKPQDLAASLPLASPVIDCRYSLADPGRGEADFNVAHVPGAVYAHLERDLSDPSKPGLGRHPLPDADAFAERMAAWGWRSGQKVVVYDGSDSPLAAARLWWMLRSTGIDAQLLNGGWRAWLAAGLPTERGPATKHRQPPAALRFDKTRSVGYLELQELLRQPSTILLDARARARFRGDSEPIDRVAGHVPGARNRPMAQNFDAAGHFKSTETLRREFLALLGTNAPGDVVHMCGSGVSACQNQLAMEIAGLHGSRIFIPSWSGWSSDPNRPIATGNE